MIRDLGLLDFLDHLEACRKMKEVLKEKRDRLKVRVGKALAAKLPPKTYIDLDGQNPCIYSKLGKVVIHLPVELDVQWSVYAHWPTRHLWFEMPPETPVEVVVEDTITRLVVDSFSKPRG